MMETAVAAAKPKAKRDHGSAIATVVSWRIVVRRVIIRSISVPVIGSGRLRIRDDINRRGGLGWRRRRGLGITGLRRARPRVHAVLSRDGRRSRRHLGR